MLGSTAGTVVGEVANDAIKRIEEQAAPPAPTAEQKAAVDNRCEDLRIGVLEHIDVERDAVDLIEGFGERFPDAVGKARYKAKAAFASRKVLQRMAVELDCNWALPRR